MKTLDHKKEFLIGFMRGYFDGDGHFDKFSPRADITTISEKMAYQLIFLHETFGYKPRLFRYDDKRSRKPRFTVRLNKEDALRFIEMVRPRNPIRLKNVIGAAADRTRISTILSSLHQNLGDPKVESYH